MKQNKIESVVINLSQNFEHVVNQDGIQQQHVKGFDENFVQVVNQDGIQQQQVKNFR